MTVTKTLRQHTSMRFSEPPPLESGDRLTRREFERRYHAMPEVKKAELIEGVVYVASPVRFQSHGKPHSQIIGWLAVYAAATRGVELADNATVRLDPDNEPQPDALLLLPESSGGRAAISADDYIEGPPDLVFEIAASSAAYDLHDKRDVYRRNGVREYAVWQVYDERIDWWALEDEVYAIIEPDEAGMIRSRAFPGLWLDRKALLEGDMAKVLAALQQGIATDEHAAFAKQLAESDQPSS
ncbi:MAG TPA: Uma2 family endonuclease [Roseiflexaceae bacterium]|nr:Uma2 family endonuclease [Roseiflexaceae bacterium]